MSQHSINYSNPVQQGGQSPQIAIQARGLSKTYGGTKRAPAKLALNNLSLDILQGSIFGLLGPNGAGKSTFINILAGTVVKTAGQVSVWGADLDINPRQVRANIGIVPQELNIDAFFTPRELLEFNAGLYGVPRAERRTDDILNMVGLSDKAHAYARTLSGGMRRRLLVAKAMVHQPPILVLDEPTAGVDVTLRQRLWDNIRELNESGVTIVLTTHYLEEAQALCDQIAILDHGRILTCQPTATLLNSAGRKDVTIALPSGAPQHWPEVLVNLQPMMTEDCVTFRFDPAHITVGAILTSLIDGGVEIGDVSTSEPDLEDIFLEMTGHIETD
jgi:ABC-2 type transport system ATP-binding protein